MLMVLQASQISAEEVPACNLARSMRFPKATPDDAAGDSAKEIEEAAVMDALFDEGQMQVHRRFARCRSTGLPGPARSCVPIVAPRSRVLRTSAALRR